MAQELTLEQIREKLKGSDYDSDAWAMEYFRWGQANGLTVEEWIAERNKIESDYLELQKNPGIGDMGPTVLINAE